MGLFDPAPDRPVTPIDVIRFLREHHQSCPQHRELIEEISEEFMESEMSEAAAYRAGARLSEEVHGLPEEDLLNRASFLQAIAEGNLELLKEQDEDEEDESAEPGGGDVG